MSSDASVTTWLHLLKNGDPLAAQELWERYFHLLVALARKRLGSAPRRSADEEDAALSAFDSFCRGVEKGRFPRLDDRRDLWRLLLIITKRKAWQQVHHEKRVNRGGGEVVVETDLRKPGQEGEDALLNEMIGSEPTPELVAQVTEECRCLLDKLGDDTLRKIAIWKMEGYTVEEIAVLLGRSERTVAHKLTVIRDCWRLEEEPS
jgi:DNA-directed RNA polymerase specialized sigma24 family protein